ncbi:MAG: hypothetical protein LBR86_08900, partial [Tannerella sp.]|nr:hypothetical protein [Tannerella sp.]
EITAINANLVAGQVVISDTLPPYLDYAIGSATGASISTASGSPSRDVVTFTVTGVSPYATTSVRFKATPESGASASQPLFVNTAYVTVSDSLHVPTNSTNHQGAGVSVILFSASAGGSIYNADRQVLDYRTSPRAGVLVVPDSGYVFAGWSHDEYISLRGEVIPADSGIVCLDSLIIYGNVELRADFVPGGAGKEGKDLIPGDPVDTGDKVWSNGETLYVRTKKGARVHVYTPDGVLHYRFDTAIDGVTTLRLTHGLYIVTLNGGTGSKVVISERSGN